MLFILVFGTMSLTGCLGNDNSLYWEAESVANILQFKSLPIFKRKYAKKRVSDVAIRYWKKKLPKSALDCLLVSHERLIDAFRKKSEELETILKHLCQWNFFIKVTDYPVFPQLVVCPESEPGSLRFVEWLTSFKEKVNNMDPVTKRATLQPLLTKDIESPSTSPTQIINADSKKETNEPFKDTDSPGPSRTPPYFTSCSQSSKVMDEPFKNMDSSPSYLLINTQADQPPKGIEEPLNDAVSPGALKTPPNIPFLTVNTEEACYTPCSPVCSSPSAHELPDPVYIPCSPTYEPQVNMSTREQPSTDMLSPQEKIQCKCTSKTNYKRSSAFKPYTRNSMNRPDHCNRTPSADEELPSPPTAAPVCSVWWDAIPPNIMYFFYGNEIRCFTVQS